MPIRKILETWGLATLIVCGAVYWVLSVFHDEIRYADSCDSTEPVNSAQTVALADLKSRKSAECEGPGQSCQYLISEQDDGAILIRFYPIFGASGSQCMAIDCCFEEHVYTAQGKYVRCDGCLA